jgi:DNA polymerase zeta
LRILFETKNVSLVKKYVVRQFDKIVTGRVSLQDLTFAKEYRGASGYRPGACVPALELARKWTAVDKRNEPRRSERVPYVIAAGPPGVPLIRLVRSPREFLQDPSLRPNAIYYITKVIIPPINRCFNLIGADLHGWFNQMPRKQFQYLRNSSPVKRSTISQYFASNSCAVCGEHTQKYLCEKCAKRPQSTVVMLHEKVRLWEQSFRSTSLVSAWFASLRLFISSLQICQTCTGILDELPCISLDCPVLYRVNQTTRDLQQTTYVREVVNSLRCEPEIL